MQLTIRRAMIGLVATAMASAGIGVLAPAADAAAGDTSVTFTITSGALSISVPGSSSLTGINTGATSTFGSLGNTQVSDARGGLGAAGNWTVSVTNPTTFHNTTTGGSTADETVPNTGVYYCSGTSNGSGLGVFVPTGLSGALCTTLNAAQVGTGVTGASWTNTAGNSSQTWNPTLLLSLRSSQVAGNYSGTVNQSVS